MKIESIHIQHFGHFVDFDLEFGRNPFVLLFGRNEAGKTTLLEFLRQLLFGFPERTPYNFGDGGELGGSARLTLADRRVVELKRRKGRKNTLQARVAGSESELDDAGFRQLLGNANENVFRTVFAFGLDELRTGNEGLKDESLQSALFGGGLGGALNPESLLKELETEAGELFRPSASKPAINALAAELRKMASEIKQHAIRPDEYEQRERSWKDAQAEADRLTAELGDLRRRHARTERLIDALPRWLRLQALRVERQRMTIPEAFPRDAEHQFRTANDAIRRLEREITALKGESETSRQQLGVLQLDKTLLPLRAEIEECHRLIQSVTDARRDLPLRREERVKLREDITAEVQRLRPGWTLDDLRTFSLPTAISHALEELNRRELELNEERTRLQTRRDEIQAASRQSEADLEALGAASDVTSLIAVLEQAVDFAADQKSLKKEQDEHSKLLRTLESQRARLSPPLQISVPMSLDAIQQLPVPPRELVHRFAAEMRDLQQQRKAARQAVSECEKAREQLHRELFTLECQPQSVPSLDELRQQRAERDAMWSRLREQHIEPNSEIGIPAPHPDRYELAVRAADQTADRIYEHADDVARREQVNRTLIDLSNNLNRKQEECRRVEQQQADLEQKWRELWRPCGFEPLTCDLMLTWLETFTSFIETHDLLAQRQVELASTQKRVAGFEERLRLVMQDSDGEIKSLLTSAKLLAKNAEENAQQRKRLERDRKRFEKQLEGLEDDLRKFGDADALWKSEWRQVLQKIGLPADWNASLARDVLGQLAAAREKLASLTELDRRIEQMDGRLAEFDPRVRRICEQLEESVDPERPEINAASLQQRLAEATQAQERRTNLEARVAKNQGSERELSGELTDWRAKREQLLVRAGASSDEDFLAIAERTRRASELDSQIQDLCGQLAVARGHESEEAFSVVLDAADAGMLQAELGELTAKLHSQQLAADQARETAGSLRCQFEELDGSNMAALLQERMAQQQAKLATEIHRYVPLVFAKHLLQAAIKRFERENQPEMIKGISQMLATMTRGRYLEIERPTSDRASLYILGKDGTERSPDQLSTGTREQLYLAIRLGYVLHYCRQAEPLPIVMDDVLVNFDAERATATLESLRDVSQQAQILFFTCHQHVVDMVQQVYPGIQPLELPTRERRIEVAGLV